MLLSRPMLSIVLCATQLLCAVTASKAQDGGPVAQPDYAPLRKAIVEFRNGSERTLELELRSSDFRMLRSATTTITKEVAESALTKAAGSIPEIRFVKDSITVSYKISPYRWIERTSKSGNDKAESWARRSFVAIATFPNSEWNSFVAFALSNGMSDLIINRTSEGTFGLIKFSASGPERVIYGGQSLTFSPAFYQSMRVSPDYKSSAGAKGFVVLIHDPHGDVAGRHDLMEGLESLSQANPTANFEFLVEGAFPEMPGQNYFTLQSRSISDGGLGPYLQLQPASLRGPMVQAMLRKFMIDTPLAYRLTHPTPFIPAYAIDDNRFLKETYLKQSDRKSTLKAIQSVSKTSLGIVKQTSISEVQKQAALSKVVSLSVTAIALELADVSNVSDALLIEYETESADALQELVRIANGLKDKAPNLAVDAAVLDQRSKEYRREVDQDQRALERNVTMQSFIIPEARKSSSRIPIAFIGSYHTQGIVAELKKEGIGFVVLEPRPRILFRDRKEEEDRFEQFVTDPDDYFHKIRHSNKGLAGLTDAQVNNNHKPFSARVRANLERNQALWHDILTPSSSSSVDVTRLQGALFNNLPDCQLAVSGGIRGQLPPPPDAPAGSFAFFEEWNGTSKLTLIDVQSDRWKEGDRYSFLQKAGIGLPFEDEGYTPEMSFSKHFQDDTTGRGFYLFYNHRSKRAYLVEGTVPEVAALVTLPSVGKNRQIDVHMQLSENLKTNKEMPNGQRDTTERTPGSFGN